MATGDATNDHTHGFVGWVCGPGAGVQAGPHDEAAAAAAAPVRLLHSCFPALIPVTMFCCFRHPLPSSHSIPGPLLSTHTHRRHHYPSASILRLLASTRMCRSKGPTPTQVQGRHATASEPAVKRGAPRLRAIYPAREGLARLHVALRLLPRLLRVTPLFYGPHVRLSEKPHGGRQNEKGLAHMC